MEVNQTVEMELDKSINLGSTTTNDTIPETIPDPPICDHQEWSYCRFKQKFIPNTRKFVSMLPQAMMRFLQQELICIKEGNEVFDEIEEYQLLLRRWWKRDIIIPETEIRQCLERIEVFLMTLLKNLPASSPKLKDTIMQDLLQKTRAAIRFVHVLL